MAIRPETEGAEPYAACFALDPDRACAMSGVSEISEDLTNYGISAILRRAPLAISRFRCGDFGLNYPRASPRS
jgi:hypothetical protein